MTGDHTVLLLASRLLFTAVATFLAIAVWAKIRDGAWMLLVSGVIAGYADILYNLLVHYGLLQRDWPLLFGFPVLPFVLVNLPWLFYSAAFIVILRRYRSR
ncbi:MAG: hypothetical protein KKI09_11750 [Spirochaetes bacterium]|nr:hypothetical protein [Spirochaetota bacterium]MBU0956093.1 hypothetical protein [Spirochaetota bacterium]